MTFTLTISEARDVRDQFSREQIGRVFPRWIERFVELGEYQITDDAGRVMAPAEALKAIGVEA